MCHYPLFETLAIINGEIQGLEYHQQRYEYALKYYFKAEKTFDLNEIIEIPTEFKQGKVRAKISYNPKQYHLEFFPYKARTIDYFQCVYPAKAEYTFKYSDRRLFNQYKLQKGQEIILIRQGKVSDCSIGNLLFNRHGMWYSPRDYLLRGTQLSRLLDEQKVELCEIRVENLFDYQQVMMINALNPFDPTRAIAINRETIRI